ncbi:MAG: hypothetical protein Q7J06_12390 [Bacteroidales bacterium]|nr:hypothetical protein [Bacteroidales bacterium]
MKEQYSITEAKPSKAELTKLYYEDRLSMNQIWKSLGLGEKVIRNLFNKYDIARRSPGEGTRTHYNCPIILPDDLRDLYIDHRLSVREIAQRYNTSYFWILKQLREFEIPVRTKAKGYHKKPPKLKEVHPCAVCGRITKNRTFCSRFCQLSPTGRQFMHLKVQNTVLSLPRELLSERIRKASRPPNKYERMFDKFLQDNFPSEWKYVGDGKLIIDRKNPDFININGKKAIIELWGDYWHKGDDPERLIDFYGKYGYRTLVIWTHELKHPETLKEKIRRGGVLRI